MLRYGFVSAVDFSSRRKYRFSRLQTTGAQTSHAVDWVHTFTILNINATEGRKSGNV